jgi:suppressor of ftsI
MKARRPRAAIAAASSVLVIALTVAGCSLIGSGLLDGGHVSTVGKIDFVTPLAIPALAASTVENGVRHFDLTAENGSREFVADESTDTSGYNGSYLGPTIEATRGEQVEVTLHNELGEVTTLHWHGMHLPAAIDGGPHQPVVDGETMTAAWTIDQPAATLWYHPHPHGETADQVAHGLAGMFIVRDAEESALALPRTYGVDDIPVIVQDARFSESGNFFDGNRGFVGSLGDTLLVNGTVGPFLDVATEAVRLRLLNGSPARTYNFAFDDARLFDQVASDGGLLAAPFATDHVQLSPGERAEIVVRLVAGEAVVLRSTEPDFGGDDWASDRNGGTDAFDVLELRAASDLVPSPATPTSLAHFDRMTESEADEHRSMTLDGFDINGQSMTMDRIDDVVTVGDTEVWTVRNQMDLPHSFHVHDVQFQVLSVNGDQPPPELAGWKDTVLLRPRTDYALIMRFSDYTDPNTPYMYHCHLLWHEDQGMMGQFVVVKPGQSAGTIKGDNHDHHH